MVQIIGLMISSYICLRSLEIGNRKESGILITLAAALTFIVAAAGAVLLLGYAGPVPGVGG